MRWLGPWLCGLFWSFALPFMTDACAQPQVLDHMQALESSAAAPPDAAAGWVDTPLPHSVAAPSAGAGQGAGWYRGGFEVPATAERASWAVYLPYLYEGGQVWLNGSLVGAIPESTPETIVRWERPQLLPLPAPLLKEGMNELAIRTAGAPRRAARHVPRVQVGLWQELQPVYDQRMFWVRTMPQVTVVVCTLAAGFSLFIYWRRRSESLYGLFGLTAALWGLRTLTFVIEAMPTGSWNLWRLAYHVATGGFIMVLTMFSLRFVGLRWPRVERGLLLYWLIGPAWLVLAGPAYEPLVNRLWTGGTIPITWALLAVMSWASIRQRKASIMVLTVALVVCVAAGLHDYLVAWNAPFLVELLPAWARQRYFLLHHAANILLLAMGGMLTARFVRALSSQETLNARLEELNQTLESRVAEREKSLATNFERLAALQRQNAASQERQLIMREIHDGLGSRLFTSLLRVERGEMDHRRTAEVLRECIADMRMALDAMAPDHDFQVALGNFLFRWQTQLQEAHIQSTWAIDVPEDAMKLPPQSALQLLHIAQEALTNVLKHARARHVCVELRQRATVLELEITDDGIGAEMSPDRIGHGVSNMRARARRLDGRLDLLSTARGTRVLLQMPLASAAPLPEIAMRQAA